MILKTSIQLFHLKVILAILKNLVRSPSKPLRQIHRRLQEFHSSFLDLNKYYLKNSDKNKYLLTMEHRDGPLFDVNTYKYYKQYTKMSFADVTFSIYHYSIYNCYCNLKSDRKIVQIHNIVRTTTGEVFLIGKHFIEYSSLYFYPCDSSLLNIHVVKGLSDLKIWLINLIRDRKSVV